LLGEDGGPAAARFREAIEQAEDLPVFHARTLLDDADLGSPAGRDRALDEVVEVIAAMPDSITREELKREVADRLDADPALVERRVAAGKGRRAAPAGDDGSPARPAPARELTARDRKEMALLAMCVAAPDEGQAYLEKLTDEHFASPVAGRARAWLVGHLDQPLHGLGRDDEELLAYVTEVKMRADREPASPEAIEVNYRVLERDLLDRQIAELERANEVPPVELQKRRAELNEQIARSGVA
jgi:DNA primase